MTSHAFIQTLVEKGSIDSFDVMLGQKIQESQGTWLGIYVSKAFRQGHMAVRIEQSQLFPRIEHVFSDDGAALDRDMIETISTQIRSEIDSHAFGHLIIEGETMALPHAHTTECRLAEEVVRLCSAPPFITIENIRVDERLNEGQRSAVAGALKTPFSCITGGPGTGKTFTAGAFLQSLARATPVRPLRVVVAAPTGRAVQTLEATIRNMVGDGGVLIDAKTIHSLVLSQKRFLPYHLAIIDECSMISSSAMEQLLQRLHSGTRVVMLGDPDQLPSIDPGQPFFNLLEVACDQGPIGHYALTECRRTASPELTTLSHLVRSGDTIQFTDYLATTKTDVQFLLCATKEDWKKAERLIDEEMVLPWKRSLSLDAAKQQLRKKTLLTPQKRGPFGTEQLNNRSSGTRLSPVLCVKNSYQLGVMNGDIGILEQNEPMDHIHFEHCVIPAILCPRLEKAFAMTIHKSQGSEFETVLALLPPGTKADRRLLYTAITRAKKKLILIGQQEALVQALHQKNERVSTLADRIKRKLIIIDAKRTA